MLCLFDASSGLFFLLQLAYAARLASLPALLCGFAAAVAVVGAAAAALLPSRADVAGVDAAYEAEKAGRGDALLGGSAPLARVTSGVLPMLEPALERAAAQREHARVGGRSRWAAVCSYASQPRFRLAVMFMAVFTLKNSFYIGTLSQQMEALGGGSASASFVPLALDIILPVGGLLCIPLSSYILVRWRDADHVSFGVVLFLGVTHGALNLAPLAGPQYAAVAVFAVLRTLKWTCYAEFIVKHYPLEHMV